MPIENTASRSVTTPWAPPSVSLAKPAKVVRKIEPKNHSHEIPSSDRNTVRLPRACPRLVKVSLTGFQLIASAGSEAGERGTKPAAMRPTIASATDTDATQLGPSAR